MARKVLETATSWWKKQSPETKSIVKWGGSVAGSLFTYEVNKFLHVRSLVSPDMLASTPELKHVRKDVDTTVQSLKDYRKNFKREESEAFVILVGPKAAGKTTSIERAFGGSKVLFLETTLQDQDATANLKTAIENAFRPYFSFLYNETARSILRYADWMSRSRIFGTGEPLVIYWSLSAKKGADEMHSLRTIAEVAATSARQLSFDHPGGNIAVVIETSNPTLGALIPTVHQTCETLFLDHMSYTDFVKAFDADPFAKNFTARLGGKDKYKDHLKEYYSCFSGNLRGLKLDFLKPLMAVKDAKDFQKEFAGQVEEENKSLKKRFRHAGLTSGQEELCLEIAKQGPVGLKYKDTDAVLDMVDSIREKKEALGLLRVQQRNTIRLHYMAHVRYLLGRMYDEEKKEWKDKTPEETMAAMEEHGWLPKTVKAGSA
eukprot:TRINITY_DN688_c0_g1_i2.p1 TRINITY_DN688_c0_g1~~TRINITY_DN688_c0_g1_i2.p1  ORF type:complete len:450 (+),score=83.20 TRINITY_DN688_c0_g1_i2:55-1350(+)